jgi:hypothetical protein
MKITKEKFEKEFKEEFKKWKMTKEKFNLKITKEIFDEECGTSKTSNFEKIGLIEKKVYTFSKVDRERINSPEFVKDNDEDEIATPEGICYLWVLKKNEEYFPLYVGQTSQTFEKRFNSGHRRACRERNEKHSNKNIRFMNILLRLNDNDEVQVWVRKSNKTKLFGKTVSLRKVEEDALIERFNPYLNA